MLTQLKPPNPTTPQKTHRAISACRYCKHYGPTGRRGGICDVFGTYAASQWEPCSLAAPMFSSKML